jgi:SAM-dependent methyltransferase
MLSGMRAESSNPTTVLVRGQYERFPYPPVSALGLPRRGEGGALAYEQGLDLARAQGLLIRDAAAGHRGIRILVAGGGTLEPLVVAQVHPHAQSLTVVDFSAAALTRARRRWRWGQLRRRMRLAGRGEATLPRVDWFVDDLWQWQGGPFDYIVATNVLHHTQDGAGLLARLAAWLAPNGLLRVVTYPKHSRLWLRETGAFLRANGIDQNTPHLVRRAQAVLRQLPPLHPLRLCFETHRESGTAVGIVDAFLHRCEHPLAPLEWGQAAAAAGLRLIGEGQHVLSRSVFLDELAPAAATLDTWSKLEVLDRLLELSANPVFWFCAASAPGEAPVLSPEEHSPGRCAAETGLEFMLTPAVTPQRVFQARSPTLLLPSRSYYELGRGLRRAESILTTVGVGLPEILARLRQEVGSHFSADGKRELPGFAASDYDARTLLAAPQPWGDVQWAALQQLAGGACHLRCSELTPPAADLVTQARWLQGRLGSVQAQMQLAVCWETGPATNQSGTRRASGA